MMQRLNFNCSQITVFLAFVSFLNISSSYAQTKDEFAEFEAELSTIEAGKTPATTPTTTPPSSAKAASAPPPPAPAPSPVAMTADEKIEKLKKEIRSSPKNVSLITSLAAELYKKDQYEKVTLLLWKHIDIIKRPGLIVLAKAHERRKESPEMVRALNVLLGKDETDFEAHTLMGVAYVLGKKNREALGSYKKAVELNPKYEPAYDGLIALYESREPANLYELRILFQDLIDNIGARPQYLHKLCEINTLDATCGTAITGCREAIIKDPQGASSYVNLGICLKATGEDAEALKTFKKAAQDFPKSEFAHYQYAKVLEEQKNYVEAMNLFKHGVDIDPKAARSWLGLATSSFEIRKYEIALVAYQKACKFDRKTSVAFRKATTILRNQKDSRWAEKFESASETCTFNN